MTTPVSTRSDGPEETPSDAWVARDGRNRSRWKSVGSARRVPYLLLGAVLVVACTAAAVIVSMRVDQRQLVLVLARPVAVGHVLSSQDFRQVAVSSDIGLDAVPAAEASTVVGRSVAYSLPSGVVLTRGSVGVAQVPASGQAIAAVGLESGQFPPALSSGARVAVLVSASSSTDTSVSVGEPMAEWTATVTTVGPAPDEQTTVVSLQLPESDARELATAPAGQVRLVALDGGDR